MKLCCASRGAMKLAFLIAAWVAVASAPAMGQSSLEACVDRVVNAAREQGAKPGPVRPVDFLLSGDERSHDYELPEFGCLGFVAVGHRQVLHLGLSLFDPSGANLARDRGRDAHAYARFCGEAGQRVVVNVRMLDGEGEVHLVSLRNAPSELDALKGIMATCMSTGTARPELVDVGPEPSGPSLEDGLLSVARALVPLGYELESELISGKLLERRRDLRQFSLTGGRCYALAAVGDGDVEDIDLRLLSLTGSGSLIASDVTRSREAIVKVCPEQGADYALDVRMYRGGGSYLVQSYALNEALGPPPPGVDGNTRIAYTELIAQLGERGMRSVPVAWGLVESERTQAVPVKLQAGYCYAVGTVASGDVGTGDLDMSLIDDRGRFLAAEIGPNPNPLVYHCAERDMTARAVVRSHQIAHPARFLVLLGEQAAESRP
jgi:hypothetical protein